MKPITSYHAHIYYEDETKEVASRIRQALSVQFSGLVIGRMHDQPIGPHTKPQFSAELTPDHFGQVVPWLMLCRQGLSVLVHPLTGDEWADHTEHPLWLGEKVPLDLTKL